MLPLASKETRLVRLDRFKNKEFNWQTQQFIDRQIRFAFFVGLGFTEPKSKCKSEIAKHILLTHQLGMN